ncbi:MAG: glycine betaine ABC transporter substrate-binding protein [Fidelibacterota bacterium]
MSAVRKRATTGVLLWVAFSGLEFALERPVVVGSKPFTESYVLAELLSQIIEVTTPYRVTRRFGLEGTYACFGALRKGDIDVYPEYTGTGALTILKSSDEKDQEIGVLKQKFENVYRITWLEPFGFNNTWALVIPEALAQERKIYTYSQLARQAGLRAAFTHEFLQRQDGWQGLQETYGFDFKDVKGIRHHLAYEALEAGKIEVTDAYSTDGEIVQQSLRVLEDDRHFFPQYLGAPVVRQQTLRDFPGLEKALNTFAGRIDNATMQQLNLLAREAGETYPAVVSQFLSQHGIQGAPLEKRGATILRHTGRHLFLTGLAVVAAILFGVPGGIWMSRSRRVAGTLMSFANVVQTIPSIALLGALIPLLGIGFKPAIVALFLYSILPILRNTFTGITDIPRSLTEVADAQGLTSKQKLVYLELPQAVPVMLAGIRTSTVICVGTATLAAFIGAGGLGEPILTGISLNDTRLILSGAVPAALLALVLDFLLHKAEGLLNPHR